jgi:hypothetical protein
MRANTAVQPELTEHPEKFLHRGAAAKHPGAKVFLLMYMTHIAI